MSDMTLREVRDAVQATMEGTHCPGARNPAAWIKAIDAHLAQPAQTVDVVAWRFRDDARPGLPWKSTTDCSLVLDMKAKGGYEIEPLTPALSGEKAGPVGNDVLLETARASGLRNYLHGVNATDAKRLLRAFVDALPASPTPDKEG